MSSPKQSAINAQNNSNTNTNPNANVNANANPNTNTNANTNTGGGESRRKESSNGYSIESNKYRQNLEEVKQKNLNSPEMLIASVNNIIHQEDSIIYYPKNIHLLCNKYPVYPLRLKEELLINFDIDTLFFIFFEQANSVAKEMARKEIIKRGWMFNQEYKTFFKLKREPISSNDNYIEGDFDLFDHEKEWKIKPINNFKFIIKDSNK